MRKYTVNCLLFLTLCLLLPAAAAFSQSLTGGIKGVVTDPHGVVLPGVFVEIKSRTGRVFEKGVFTDSKGEFAANDLLPGAYEVTADVQGMKYRNESVLIYRSEITKLDISVSYEANCASNASDTALELTDGDRTEIVSSILEGAVLRREIPDHQLLLKQKGPIVLSLETIKAEWVKQIPNMNLAMMSEKEIKNRANRKGDFLYLEFSNWKIEGNCVAVTLSNTWAVADDSKFAYLSGGGNHYLYQRDNGKWLGKILGGWIS